MAAVRKRTWTYKGEVRTRWVVCYTDLTGKRRLETLNTKREAVNRRLKIEDGLEAGTHVAASASKTVSEVLDLFMDDRAQKVRRVTLRGYETAVRLYLRPKLGGMRVASITTPMVQTWLDGLLADGCSAIQIRRTRFLFGQMFSFAMRRGHARHNPVKGGDLELPKVKKPKIIIPEIDEIRLVLAEAKGMPRVIIHTAVMAGLRTGELKALDWTNIGSNEPVIRVRGSMDRWCAIHPPKSDAGLRDVPIPSALFTMLREWNMKCGRPTSGLIFFNKNGGPLGDNSIHQLWTVALSRAGLTYLKEGVTPTGIYANYGWPKYHFHSLRHLCVSLWLKEGMDVKTLMTRIGHATVKETFDTYGHLMHDEEESNRIVEGISERLLR